MIMESYLLTSVESSGQESDNSIAECSVYTPGRYRVNTTTQFSLNFRDGTHKPDLIKPRVCYMVFTHNSLQPTNLSRVHFIVRATERDVSNWICVLLSEEQCCYQIGSKVNDDTKSVKGCMTLLCTNNIQETKPRCREVKDCAVHKQYRCYVHGVSGEGSTSTSTWHATNYHQLASTTSGYSAGHIGIGIVIGIVFPLLMLLFIIVVVFCILRKRIRSTSGVQTEHVTYEVPITVQAEVAIYTPLVLSNEVPTAGPDVAIYTPLVLSNEVQTAGPDVAIYTPLVLPDQTDGIYLEINPQLAPHPLFTDATAVNECEVSGTATYSNINEL